MVMDKRFVVTSGHYIIAIQNVYLEKNGKNVHTCRFVYNCIEERWPEAEIFLDKVQVHLMQ